MDILHEDDGKKGRFYIDKGDENLAEITYVWVGEDKLIIDHTFVDESLKGQSIGYKLVLKIVEMARKRKVVVIPLCPFAKATIEKKPELQDVLARS
jgi:predicted GNAT family acetyltransferase